MPLTLANYSSAKLQEFRTAIADSDENGINDDDIIVPFDLHSSISFVLGIVLVLISIVGIIGSGISLYIFTIREMRPTSINILLAGLAVCDGAVALFGGPVFSTIALCAPLEASSAACTTAMAYSAICVYPLAMMAQTASIWTIIAVTCERLIVVCFPLHAKSYCSPKRAKLALAVIATASVGFNFVRFFEYELIYRADMRFYTVKAVLKNNDDYLSIYMLWLNFITHFIVPTAILVSFNTYIIILLKRCGGALFVVCEQPGIEVPLSSHRRRFALRRFSSQSHVSEQRTTWMMVTVTALFLLCNTSAFILNALEAFRRVDSNWRTFLVLSDVNNLLVMFSSSVNCFIYYRFSVKYRRHFKALLRTLGILAPESRAETLRQLFVTAGQISRSAGIVAGCKPENMRTLSPHRIRALAVLGKRDSMNSYVSTY